MISPATALIAAEMVRDGGSFSAMFRCADSTEFALFFRVQVAEHPLHGSERVNYLPPVLKDKLAGTEVSLSWEHAQVMLSQLCALAIDGSSREVLEIMSEIAQSKGERPSRVPQYLGRALRLGEFQPRESEA